MIQNTENQSILSIISAVKSDAFSRLIKMVAANISKYYTQKDIRNTDAVILNEIATGKSIKEINTTLEEKWNLSPERVRQLINKTLRRVSNLSIISRVEDNISKIEKKFEVIDKENRMLKHKIKLLEEYIAANEWKNLQIKIKEEDFDKIDFSQMSTRLRHTLLAHDITYYKELLNLSYKDIRKFRNCGQKSIEELKNFLISKGYNVDWEIK